LARERDRLTIVADQLGCPTAARDVAQACLTTALRCGASPARGSYGLYHFAGAGEATWCEFAKTIVELAHFSRPIEVVPVRTSEYPTPAIRPADTRLDCGAVVRDYGIEPRPWQGALEETLSRMLES
jgi:dTDP-4-dehydrorhamnose reductase